MNHKINGWSFEIEEDKNFPISWVCKNITQLQYNFAKEILINKIIVEIEGQVEPVSLTFDNFEKFEFPDFPYINAFELENSPYLMQSIIYGCKTIKDVLPNSEDFPLYIWYGISVGSYDNQPPHEFSGLLKAARFNPNIHFITENKDVKSVRVDYKLHFDVDSYLKDDSLFTQITEKIEDWKKKDNYCSLLQDADHFPASAILSLQLINEVGDIFENLDRIIKFFKKALSSSVSNFRFIIKPYSMPNKRIEIVIENQKMEKSDPIIIDLGELINLLYGTTDFSEYDINKISKYILNYLINYIDSKSIFDRSFLDDEFRKLYYSSGKISLYQSLYVTIGSIILSNFFYTKFKLIEKKIKQIKAAIDKDMRDILPYIKKEYLEKILLNQSGISSLIETMLVKPIFGDIKIFEDTYTLLKKFAGNFFSVVGFTTAEKPVLTEMVGYFVKNSTDKYDRNTWDNLHWWGTDEIPSAPGAFHAIHSHFHWGDFLSYPEPEEKIIVTLQNLLLGTKNLKGTTNLGLPQWRTAINSFKSKKIAGPLIDPKIPNQQIQFAVTKLKSELYNRIAGLDTLSFETIAKGLDKIANDSNSDKNIVEKSKPKQIAKPSSDTSYKGEEIVLWLSFKANKYVDESDTFKRFQGTFLTNGFYFAHDRELPFSLFFPTSAFAATQGESLQKPKDRKEQIFREPIKK